MVVNDIDSLCDSGEKSGEKSNKILVHSETLTLRKRQTDTHTQRVEWRVFIQSVHRYLFCQCLRRREARKKNESVSVARHTGAQCKMCTGGEK